MSHEIAAWILGAGVLVFTMSAQVALWQRKEYRLDRMRAYLFSPEGSIDRHPYLLFFLAAVGLGWVAFLFTPDVVVSFFGWVALLCAAAHHAMRMYRQGVWRPVLTVKSGLVVLVLVVFVIGYIRFAYVPDRVISLQMATALFFTPLFAALATALVNIPAALGKRRIIAHAKEVRAARENLTTVGITGSVGKTSTKHFLHHLLGGQQEDVTATTVHRNSEFAVAQDMLEQLQGSEVRTYIAEMGAYRPGEIKALGDLVRPRVGVITAIGTQHLFLFGSQNRLADAKWELIDALPRDGTAVLNADDSILYERGRTLASKKVVWYSPSGAPAGKDVRAEDIKVGPEHVRCTVHIDQQVRELTIPIISRGLLASALAAAAAAYALETPVETIFERLETLPRPHGSMGVSKGKNDALIVDDSYSASEHSVRNAVEYISELPHTDKRVVLVPIIELGDRASAAHERIGALLAEHEVRIAYIYGDAHKRDIEAGVQRKEGRTKLHFITHPRDIAQAAAQNVSDDTVILLEGRVPDTVHDALASD